MKGNVSLGKIITKDQALATVKACAWNLNSVPEMLRTAEMCFAAVKSNIYSIIFIPKKFQTKGLISAFIENIGQIGNPFYDFDPLELLTSITKKYRSNVEEKIKEVGATRFGSWWKT